MINVNQITARLALMPDQELQQYAKMNKNDPYTLSLALSESNRRKEMSIARQGQQGAGQQPKVVDQALSQMAGAQAPQAMPQAAPQHAAQAMPEDTGIGALPAPNMQGMADGGIVAFGSGGDVPGFAGGAYMGTAPGIAYGPYGGGGAPNQGILPDVTGYEGMSMGELISKLGEQGAAKVRDLMRDKSAEAFAARDVNYGREGARTSMGGGEVAPSVVPTAPDVSAPGIAPSVDKGIAKLLPGAGAPSAAGAPRAPGAAAAPGAPAGLPYIEQLKRTQKAMGPEVNPEQGAMESMIAERNVGAQKGKEELAADIAARADAFKGREERVGKREEELGKQKDANTGMAFLEAGLAMMQARGPALAAIAQGAGVGVSQYKSGIKDLRAAQEKLDDAHDKLDELKQNQASMDAKEIRAANKDIRDTSLTGQQYLIDARSKIHGEAKADARAATASDIAVSEAAKTRATQLQAAGIAAAPGLARNKMMQANMDTQAKIRKDYDALQAQVTSALGKDPTYMTAPPAQQAQMRTARLREALLNNPFLSQYASGVGFTSGASGGSGTVRTLDEEE